MRDILVIGIAAADVIAAPIDGYPSPGGLRTFSSLTLASGGCAVNVAIALARLGVPADVITRAGSDLFGAFLRGELEKHGVDPSGVVQDEGQSPFTFVALGTSGQRSFFHFRGSNDRLCAEDVPDAALARRRLVMVAGSMAMRRMDGGGTRRLLERARAAGARTLLDTVFVEGLPAAGWLEVLAPCLPLVDCFAPSLPEACAMTGLAEPAAIAARLMELGAGSVALKLDARGAFCRDAAGRETHVPACAVQVVDSTGAGDCFCAGLLAGLQKGLPLPEAARLGNAVAACGIEQKGATDGVPPLAEVRLRLAAGFGAGPAQAR